MDMETEIPTAEQEVKLGKMWAPTLLKVLKPEELMRYYSIEDRVAGLSIKERLTGLSIEEVRAYLKRQEQKNGVNGH